MWSVRRLCHRYGSPVRFWLQLLNCSTGFLARLNHPDPELSTSLTLSTVHFSISPIPHAASNCALPPLPCSCTEFSSSQTYSIASPLSLLSKEWRETATSLASTSQSSQPHSTDFAIPLLLPTFPATAGSAGARRHLLALFAAFHHRTTSSRRHRIASLCVNRVEPAQQHWYHVGRRR